MTIFSRKKKEEVMIGFVGVASGQVVIVDPCYLTSWKNDELVKHKEEYDFSYSGACAATLSKARFGQLEQESIQAIASSCGYGDGNYPVFATYNSEGRVASLRIDFIEE